MELFVSRAAHVADSVSHARSRRTFLAALAEFEGMLALAPGYPRGHFSEDDGCALQALGDMVIDQIEHRLDTGADRPAVQRELASRMYQIRGGLETIHLRVRDVSAQR